MDHSKYSNYREQYAEQLEQLEVKTEIWLKLRKLALGWAALGVAKKLNKG